MGLNKLKAALQKEYGADSVMMVGEMPTRSRVSSGSMALDFASGGGLPSDRCIEVAGQEGCGKTTLGLLTMVSFLDSDPRSALILDLEHKLSRDWVKQLIGPERMGRVLVAWPDHAEQATDIYIAAVSSGEISFVLFDSIGGAPTQRVTEKSATSGNIGGNSLAITRFADHAKGLTHKNHVLTFGINQIRDDMSGYHRLVTPGGRAWKHACAMRIHMKRGKGIIEEKINGEAVPIGHQVVAKVIKNQVGGVEGRTCTYWFMNVPTEQYGFGVDRLEEITRISLLTGVVQQKGGWYYYPGLPDGKILSREALTMAIKSDSVLSGEIVSQTMNVLAKGGKVANLIAPVTDPEAEIDENVVPLAPYGLDLS